MSRRYLAALAFAAVVLPATAQAQQLPTARALVDRYVEAIGGRDAVLAPSSVRMVGTYEMPAAGMRGELEVITAEPNRMLSVVRIGGMGEMRSGFDGTTSWSLDPMMGARVHSGAERDLIADQAQELAAVRDPSLFSVMETVERAEVGGQPCYRVRLVWKSGRESFDCYHTDTGLLIATSGTQESPMGSFAVTTRYSDYREFGGVRMPTRMVQEMMGAQVVMTVSSVEFDTAEPAVFRLPPQIQGQVTN